MKKLKVILLALFLVIGVSAAGNATTMSKLLYSTDPLERQIIVGDKLFSNWSFQVKDSYNTITGEDGPVFDVSLLEVVGLDEDPMNPGIRFQTLVGANSSAFFVDDGNLLDVEFTFKVSVLKPGYFIDGVSLDFSGIMVIIPNEQEWGSVGIADDIATDITELDDDGGDVTSLDPWVQWFGPDDPNNIFTDSASFDPLSEIWVRKDIILVSNGGSVNVSYIDQNFHQTAVPEPSTMLLLGAGLLGLCGVTRKKRD